MKNKGLLKRAIAVILGITMAFGALMLPDSAVKDEFSAVSAYTYDSGDCIFNYLFETDRDVKTLVIYQILNDTDTVIIPSTITYTDRDGYITLPAALQSRTAAPGRITVQDPISPQECSEM